MSTGWELVRLSAGAFVTSPGFGGVAAVGAAWFAAGTAGRRLRADYRLAAQQHRHSQCATRDADARARWWETLQWLWTNRDDTDEQVFIEALQSLGEMVETKEQSVMLEIVTKTLTQGGA